MIVGLFLSLLNVGLVAVPIGGAVGTLAGIDYYRRVHGQTPLWYGSGDEGGAGSGGGNGYTGGGGSSGSGVDGGSDGNYTGGSNYTWPGNEPNVTTVKGGVTVSEYCQQYATVNISTTTGQNYTCRLNFVSFILSLCFNGILSRAPADISLSEPQPVGLDQGRRRWPVSECMYHVVMRAQTCFLPSLLYCPVLC